MGNNLDIVPGDYRPSGDAPGMGTREAGHL